MIARARNPQADRLAALRRFALGITLLNVAGHAFWGFEQSWLQPLVTLVTAYSLELLLELLAAWSSQRTPEFFGGLRHLMDFLLPAHITGLVIAMILYPNEHLLPLCFAATVAIGSKALLRIPFGKGTRHFLNPSNVGITSTLVLFPWVGIAPLYYFSESPRGLSDWVVPTMIIAFGTFLNARLTHRLPLIASWVSGFALQEVLRNVLSGRPVATAFVPMTGLVFVLYTFYMVTDPATTPQEPRSQVAFGLGIATAYWILVLMHIAFSLFFSLTIVCALRGLGIFLSTHFQSPSEGNAPESKGEDP